MYIFQRNRIAMSFKRSREKVKQRFRASNSISQEAVTKSQPNKSKTSNKSWVPSKKWSNKRRKAFIKDSSFDSLKNQSGGLKDDFIFKTHHINSLINIFKFFIVRKNKEKKKYDEMSSQRLMISVGISTICIETE